MVEEIPYDELIDETCPSCRQTVPLGTTKCPHCGYQIREEKKAAVRVSREPSKMKEFRQPSNLIWFGGTLILMSGLLGVISGLYSLIDPDTMVSIYTEVGIPFSADTIMVLGAVSLIFGLVAVVGGVMALRRRAWAIAVVGGLLGTLAMGTIFLGSIMGLIGLMVIVTSKRFFEN